MNAESATTSNCPPIWTILLVEDEECVREITVRVLESAGYLVLAASGPDEAIRMLQHHAGPVHLLLTDMIMPGMNGSELAARLKAMRPELIVMCMSGYPSSTAALHPQGGLPGWYIQKPFTVHMLLTQVAEALAFPQQTRRPSGGSRLAF
jgi:CheY-like chemotaxis protein